MNQPTRDTQAAELAELVVRFFAGLDGHGPKFSRSVLEMAAAKVLRAAAYPETEDDWLAILGRALRPVVPPK